MRKIILFVVLFGSILPFAALAEDLPVFYGEGIVVTASRHPAPIGASPWSVTVIGSEEIERSGASRLSEVLRPVLGVDVKGSGGIGSLASLRLRGAPSENVLVLIDGERAASPFLGVADLGDVGLDDVERIEVVRGASSAIYGSEAMAGIVNIIRKKPSADGRTTVGARYGSFNTSALDFSTSGGDDLPYRVDGKIEGSDGFRRNSAFDAKKLSASMVFDVQEQGDLLLAADVLSARKGLPNVPEEEDRPLSSSTPHDRQEDTNASVSLTYNSSDQDGDSSFELKLYQAQMVQRTHLYDFFAGDFVDSSYFSLTNAIEASQVTYLSEGNVLTYGVDWREDSGRSHYSGEHSVNDVGLYIQDEASMDRVSTTLGLRWDGHSEGEDFLSSRLGIIYAALPVLDLKCSVGTAFKSPTLNQLYWNDPVWLMFGNADLRPERAVVFDAGMRSGGGGDIDLGISYFAQEITDMIVWDYDPSTFTTTARNIDRAVIQGMEADFRHKVAEGIGYRLNVSCQNPVRSYDERDPSLAGKDLPYVPRTKANAALDLGDLEGFSSSVSCRYVGMRYADSANDQEMEEYAVWDIAFRNRMEGLTWTFSVNNVFDVEYSESMGNHPVTYEYMEYPMPGRALTLMLEYEL